MPCVVPLPVHLPQLYMVMDRKQDCSPENPIYLLTYIHVLIGGLSAFFFFPQNCRHEICPASIDRDGREAVGSDNTVLYTNFNLANTN